MFSFNSVSCKINLPAFENNKMHRLDRFCGNGPYGKIATKKEPIRTLGLPCTGSLRLLLSKLVAASPFSVQLEAPRLKQSNPASYVDFKGRSVGHALPINFKPLLYTERFSPPVSVAWSSFFPYLVTAGVFIVAIWSTTEKEKRPFHGCVSSYLVYECNLGWR